MNIRSRISGWVASPLLHHYQNRISSGRLISVPIWSWNLLPQPVRKWARHRVFRPGEQHAWDIVEKHPVLGSICQRGGNPWALSPSTILYLWNILSEKKPRNIIEFGSGTSTQIFAAYAKEAEQQGIQVRICSIEHDKDWFERCQNFLSTSGQLKYVTLQHAPLTEQTFLGRRMTAYTVPEQIFEQFDSQGGFDLCLIDGPPGTIGRCGSLAIAAPHLASNAEIILDDAYRTNEQDVIAEWKQNWKTQLKKTTLLLADCHGISRSRWAQSKNGQSDEVSSRQ